MKEPLLYKITRPIICFMFKLIFNPKIEGTSNIPKEGKIILAGNHTKFWDCILLMCTTKRCIHFLAKDSLNKGIKKIIFKNMGIIPVNRKIKDKSVLPMAKKVLNNNQIIGIFPEGTINRTDDIIIPFKIGAVKMAKDNNTKIIPFAINGKYKRSQIKIKFDKPYMVTDELNLENKKLMNIISNMIGEFK